MLLKKKRKSFENLFDKKLKILLIASGYFLVFILGAYLQKNHFFYTTIKPLLFENIKFVKKIVQGKFQPIDKIYLNINFENYEKLNKIRASFLKENKIIESQNEWVTTNIKFKNNNYEAKIRLKGRVINDHLNPSMRKKNISYKVKIKKMKR